MTFLRPGKTRSGRPGSLPCNRYRNPSDHKRLRALSSGFVSFPRTRLIRSLLSWGESGSRRMITPISAVSSTRSTVYRTFSQNEVSMRSIRIVIDGATPTPGYWPKPSCVSVSLHRSHEHAFILCEALCLFEVLSNRGALGIVLNFPAVPFIRLDAGKTE